MTTDNRDILIQNFSQLDGDHQFMMTAVTQPTPERRRRIMGEILSSQSAQIDAGRSQYDQYRQAQHLLTIDRQDPNASRTIQDFNQFLTPNGEYQFRGVRNSIEIPNPDSLTTLGQLEDAHSQIQNQEQVTTDWIARSVGIFSAAVQAGDRQTAITTLVSFPDLAYQPELVTQLESLIASQLATGNLTSALLTESQTRGLAFGTLASVENLAHSFNFDDPLPPQSQESLSRIGSLREISLGLASQQVDGYQTNNISGEDYKFANQGLLPDEATRIFYAINQIPSEAFGKSERLALRIALFTQTDAFARLSPDVQQRIKFNLLGRCLGLSLSLTDYMDKQKFPDMDTNLFAANRAGCLAKALAPFISSETSTNRPADHSDLTSIETTVISGIAASLPNDKLKQKFTATIDSIVSEAKQAKTKAEQTAQTAAANKLIQEQRDQETAELQIKLTELSRQRELVGQLDQIYRTNQQSGLTFTIFEEVSLKFSDEKTDIKAIQAFIDGRPELSPEAKNLLIDILTQAQVAINSTPQTKTKGGPFGIGSKTGYSNQTVEDASLETIKSKEKVKTVPPEEYLAAEKQYRINRLVSDFLQQHEV